MTIKVLLLNFPKAEITKVPSNMEIVQSTIKENPTLHDYHVLIMDTAEILMSKWWQVRGGYIYADSVKANNPGTYRETVREQIETGGVTFLFCSHMFAKRYANPSYIIDNYFACPLDLGVENEQGDTFNPKYDTLGYFNSMLKKIPSDEIEWDCYFSKIPKRAKVLGTNRAGYSVFMEASIRAGKFIALPKFKDRSKAVTLIVNDVIPQMVHEDVAFIPQWVSEYSSPFERQVQGKLREIKTAKKLLYADNKALQNAVAFAFEKLDYKVKKLSVGTRPDLKIGDGERKGIVEVKGHINKLASRRRDVAQLVTYLSEEDLTEKAILVCNHEFNKKPSERNAEAFTDGAIQLAEKLDISLISTVDLYRIVMRILEGKLDKVTAKRIRERIFLDKGLINFDEYAS